MLGLWLWSAQASGAGPETSATETDPKKPGEASDAATQPSAGGETPKTAPVPVVPSANDKTPSESPDSKGDALQDLDRRVGGMKDQVYRAKARLSLLSERFLQSTNGSGRAVVMQVNQMGRLFQAVKVSYQLDGREIFSRGEDAGGVPKGDLAVWDGGTKPGEHTLGVTVVYRGNGNQVFGYFDQYVYTVTAAQRFSIGDGGTSRVRVLLREQGNLVTTSLDKRPQIEFVFADAAATGEGKAIAAPATRPETPAPAAGPEKGRDGAR